MVNYPIFTIFHKEHVKFADERYKMIENICSLPCLQCANINPGGHKHRYPLSVNPDWQVPPLSQWALSQAL